MRFSFVIAALAALSFAPTTAQQVFGGDSLSDRSEVIPLNGHVVRFTTRSIPVVALVDQVDSSTQADDSALSPLPEQDGEVDTSTLRSTQPTCPLGLPTRERPRAARTQTTA